MKSLLVDALRQASGAAPDKEPAPTPQPAKAGKDVEEARPEQSTAANPSAGEIRSELELIESAVLPAPPAIDVALDADIVRPEPSQPGLKEQSEESQFAAQDEAVDQLPALIETGVIEPAVILPALDIEKAAARMQPGTAAPPTPIRPRRDSLLVLARWSPALCLVAMTAAAGTLAFYQNMTATSMNVDLGGLPTQTGSDSMDSRSAPAWQRLAITEDAAERSGPAASEIPPERSAASPGTREVVNRAEPAPTIRAPSAGINDPDLAAVLSAHEAYERGDFATAERRYRAVLDANPNHSDALSGLAAILQRSERTEEALNIYSRLIAVNPDDTSAAASLAAYAQRDATTDPATRIKVMLQKKPEAGALHFALGLIMAEQQRWPEAHDAFLEASILTPDNADYSYNVAISAQHLGQLDAAQRHYSSALQKVDDTSLVDRRAILAQLERVSNGSEGDLR